MLTRQGRVATGLSTFCQTDYLSAAYLFIPPMISIKTIVQNFRCELTLKLQASPADSCDVDTKWAEFKNPIFLGNICLINVLSQQSFLQQILFTAQMSILEEHLDKINPLSNDVNRLLRLIRILDKRVEAIQGPLQAQQKAFEAKIKDLKQKKIAECPPELKVQYSSIIDKQKQIYGYCKEKDAVANQLASIVNEEYTYIKNDLKNKIKEKQPSDEHNLTVSKKKKTKPADNATKAPLKQEQFIYSAADPKYCYCLRGSFGEMVGCENQYCEREWFHLECVDEKSIKDNQWFCSDCLKMKEKYKKSFLKEYL